MSELRIFKASSPAKLNLTFAIMGDLPGGFHEVETLLQAIDLEDEITYSLQASASTQIRLSLSEEASVKDVPLDDTNLIAKAIRLFVVNLGPSVKGIRADVEIRKIIPLASGMGGGSSNAAATLLVMNRYFNSPFQKSQLEEMAAKLGSDVPFFVHGGLQIGRHKGDKLSSVPSAEKMHFVIVKPKWIAIETPWIYKRYDDYIASGQFAEPVTLKSACSAREDGHVMLAARSFINVFEKIVLENYPVLNDVKAKIMDLGALGCCMTGSGPTLFALCDSPRLAGNIAKELKKFELPVVANSVEKLTLDIWPVSTIDRGPTVVETSPQAMRQRR